MPSSSVARGSLFVYVIRVDAPTGKFAVSPYSVSLLERNAIVGKTQPIKMATALDHYATICAGLVEFNFRFCPFGSGLTSACS